MKKLLVLYYSKTGNCEFLARRTAAVLEAQLIRISPSIDRVMILFLLSALNIPVGINISQKDVDGFDEVVLFGPIWGGKLIAPLRSAIKVIRKAGKPLHFAVSCETSDDQKNDKYGYAGVLQKARDLAGGTIVHTEAFTTALIDDGQPSLKLSEKTRITEENFHGEIQQRFDRFTELLKKDLSESD